MMTMLKRFANHLDSVNWMDAVILLLGAVMIDEFYVHLAQGSFNPVIFSQQMIDFATHNQAPAFWNRMLFWMSSQSKIIAPLLGYFSAISTLFLMLLIARGVVVFFVASYFLFLWITQWVYPGAWIFEFLFPALFGFCAALATLPQLFLGDRKIYSILGPSFFGRMRFIYRIFIVVVTTLLLWYANNLSLKTGTENSIIAFHSSLTFGLLFLLLAAFDKIRPSGHFVVPNKKNKIKMLAYHFATFSWLDFMTIIIGGMLVIQVYSDIAIHWFTKHGYVNLLNVYLQTTNAPSWMKDMILAARDHVAIVMPIQIIFECTIAVLFVILVARTPFILAGALFFLTLVITEFGVPARWPAHKNDPHTWTWELMFVTIVMFFIGFQQLAIFLKSKTARERWLGFRLFDSLSFWKRFIFAAIGGTALWSAGIVTHVFGKDYHTTSLLAGVTFFILLLLCAVIDYWRPAKK
jgi:hypothetical protein